MFKVKDGDKIIEVNTPCDKCVLDYEGGAMKSGKELFKIGWHVHRDSSKANLSTTGEAYIIFIDDALFSAYSERYPGGVIQQLIEASEL